GLLYHPNANFHGTGVNGDALTITTNDNGNTGTDPDIIDPVVPVDLVTEHATDTIHIDVTSVNDAPSGADALRSILEDQTYTCLRGDFGFTDPNDSPANALLSVIITTLPAAGTLILNNVAVITNQAIALADITGGNLKFVPGANENGSNYAQIGFAVQDNGGTANGGVDTDPTPNTITFDVTSVNDAPAGADATRGILED